MLIGRCHLIINLKSSDYIKDQYWIRKARITLKPKEWAIFKLLHNATHDDLIITQVFVIIIVFQVARQYFY
jgi:hypothetical protein